MDSRCRSVQLALMEASGDVDRLEQTQRAHVAECRVCAEVASAEQRLGGLLEQVLPAADPRLEAAILAALPRRRARLRVLAFLPVAASVMVAALGALLVGGVPGSGVLSLVPVWSAQGWAALSGAMVDWGLAVVATARTTAEIVPPALALAAAALSLAGLAVMLAAVQRWRRGPAWRRDV